MLRGSNIGWYLTVYKKSIQTVIHVLLSTEDLLCSLPSSTRAFQEPVPVEGTFMCQYPKVCTLGLMCPDCGLEARLF